MFIINPTSFSSLTGDLSNFLLKAVFEIDNTKELPKSSLNYSS
jgi:hypothetical protein